MVVRPEAPGEFAAVVVRQPKVDGSRVQGYVAK
jgi:hypothetical protein